MSGFAPTRADRAGQKERREFAGNGRRWELDERPLQDEFSPLAIASSWSGGDGRNELLARLNWLSIKTLTEYLILALV